MTQEEALKILGLDQNASAFDISSTAAKKVTDLKNKIASAPTDALKAKFQQLYDMVIEAELAVSQIEQQEPVKPKRSPLSETKMADLPGMSPNAGADETSQALQLGTTLAGRYQIKEQIGAGGMGAVYRATDSNTGKDMALKVLLPALLKHERARERFLDEARISQQLSHPNIVNVYDVQQDGDYYFLTMELLEGQDLRQVMDNHKLARSVFAIDEVQEIISAISEGLAYAHKHTVHRDIKPENIWLTEQGEYKVMDFGIARVQSTSQRTQTGAAMGTAYYMAPEQLKGQSDIDGRADQYALAVLAYELLSGEVPAGMIEPIQQHRKDVPKGMANAIHQALSPRPENRFEDIQVFSEAISNAKGKGVSMPQIPRTIGIAVGIIGIVLLLTMLINKGTFNNLSNFLPQSADELAAQKAVSAKLQGEIKTYKQRLDNGRRQLSSDLRDASRNDSSDEEALKHWQTLTDNYIFNGSQITELEGDLSMGESLLRDDGFEQAQVTLTKVRDGYKNLWEQFNAAEGLLGAEQAMDKAEARWEKRKSKYSLYDPPQLKVARKNKNKADGKQREGDFGESLTLMKIAESNWDAAYDSVGEEVKTMDNAIAADRKKKAVKKAEVRRKKLIAQKAEAKRKEIESIEEIIVNMNKILTSSSHVKRSSGGLHYSHKVKQSIKLDFESKAVYFYKSDKITYNGPEGRYKLSGVECNFNISFKEFSQTIMGTYYGDTLADYNSFYINKGNRYKKCRIEVLKSRNILTASNPFNHDLSDDEVGYVSMGLFRYLVSDNFSNSFKKYCKELKKKLG